MSRVKNKHWIGIHRQPEGQKDGSKPVKGPFWRKLENVAKHRASLRVWRATVRWKYFLNVLCS
jgi:hypothetical protein